VPRFAYVNGAYVRHGDASVHIEDRGYQFADGVYEVCAVKDGKLLDEDGHFARLERSLAALDIDEPVPMHSLKLIGRHVLRLNRLQDAILYIQISRGVAPRDHAFPKTAPAPALVVTAKRLDWAKQDRLAEQGVGLISMADERWARCDIKSTSLLPNVLAKQKAKAEGGFEAMLKDEDGFVTEGSSSTIFIVDADGALVTRALGPEILPGITRETVIKIAADEKIPVIERPFTVADAQTAREVFITSASSFVLPVVQIDQKPVGNGNPGSVATRLRSAYIAQIER